MTKLRKAKSIDMGDLQLKDGLSTSSPPVRNLNLFYIKINYLTIFFI
jgi:hypothetical protein